jgi:two-component system, OmpR family, alkaline phosphatase synthesis response regulator PhoP
LLEIYVQAVSNKPITRQKMKNILVVDDEVMIVQLVRDYLEQAGYSVRTAADGLSALAIARSEKPDLIVLDLGLPGMDGLDVTRQLRRNSNAPVIMLTARSEESDKLIGLELGADDYLTKPFSPKELVARIRAIFRRIESARSTESEVIRAADLSLDLPRMQVFAEGREVDDLTPSEFQLLAALASQPGRIFTRSQLLDAIHGVAFESYERAIDAHIKNIRRKIEVDPHQPRYILTVYGVGYKFTDR